MSVRFRLSKRARRVVLAVCVISATGALATGAALAASASSKSFNWSTAKSAKAGGGKKALIKAAKKEGKLNVIALPTNWANYGKEISTFHRLYHIKVVSFNPTGSS